MKYIIVLGDGMADEPIEALENKTPLQAVSKPAIDWVAAHGRSGMLATVPAGFAPGSEIANLSVLGYDVPKVFEGRGSLEAASMGVKIEDGEMAMRCNLITIEDGKIKNHSAGHISNAEAAELIAFLQKELGGEDVNFFPGVSYRHLLKIKRGSKRIVTTPPHDVPGTPYKDVLVRAADTDGERTFDDIAGKPSGQPGPQSGRKRSGEQHLAMVAGLSPADADADAALRNRQRRSDFGGRPD